MSPPLPHLVDEILEEIFVCLPTPAALARASTACPRFRRIITDRSFLRRYRKRHPPPLLGFADKYGFHPAEAPHPSAPLARALADAADFTYSFVPKPNNEIWRPCDFRDGRVLLEGSPRWKIPRNLAVCDPLFRRYVLLPPIPKDLASQEKLPFQIKSILVPIGEDEDIGRDEDETSFKVLCFVDYGIELELVAFVFCSISQKWCIAASASWDSLGGHPYRCRLARFSGCRGVSCFNYVRGCFYSTSVWVDKLLVLDTRKMQFSTISNCTGYHAELRWLPGQVENVIANRDVPQRRRPGQHRSLPGIVVGRGGALEMLSLVGNHSSDGSFDLHHTTWENNGESSKEWQLENVIPLPSQYDYFTVGAAQGFLFLGATTEDQLDIGEYSEFLSMTDWDVDYFSLELQTSELRKVCRRKRRFFYSEDVCWYFGFPPSLSKPSI
uniref:Uncharacterized protein n=5 Tax=Avena sativa TaxID=4498 RepID=A0ACD5V857_AVESA